MRVATLGSGIRVRYRAGEPEYPALFCIHGYGASSASFLEAFEAPELRRYPIYAPDLPGFGESPRGEHPRGLAGAAEVLIGIISTHAGGNAIALLAHSAGGLIATRAAQVLPNLRCLVNIEGNLTEADNFLSGRAAAAADIDSWRRGLIEDLHERAETDEAYARYLRDLARASPAALREWAVETVAETGTTSGGDRYRTLACSKLYVYGGLSIPPASLEYLEAHDLPRLAFPEAGHSPMIDEPARFYAAVADFIAGCATA